MYTYNGLEIIIASTPCEGWRCGFLGWGCKPHAQFITMHVHIYPCVILICAYN